MRVALHNAKVLLDEGFVEDCVVVIEGGRIVASGPAAQIAADGTLEKAYLG